jgi:sugar transferase (PEP-CTERM/EpsH1 system associated)
MRILWLKSDLLLPLDKGGKLRTWHLLRQLARRHEITYVAFAPADEPAANLVGMREVAHRVETIPRSDVRKRSLRFYTHAAMHVFRRLPYAIGRYRSSEYQARVEALLREQPFDVAVCDFLLPAVNLPQRLPCPSVLFTHNVEAEIWRRHAETCSGWAARRLYAMQHRRMLRFERHALARFDAVLAVSDADRATLQRMYSGSVRAPIHVIPTGVDTEFFTPAPSAPTSRSLVFTGSMDWLPNEDAMTFFGRDVLPLIRAEEPDVTVKIVGRAPTPPVVRLGREPGIHVTGRVDDVRPFMHDAAVYVVPLRIGGGTRLKIFEAMAMGKAVVSTRVGAEGLPVVDERHLVLADDPREFASAVVRLLRDVNARHALESAARALVVEHYDWEGVAGSLDAALTRVVRAARASTTDAAASPSGAEVRAALAEPPGRFAPVELKRHAR